MTSPKPYKVTLNTPDGPPTQKTVPNLNAAVREVRAFWRTYYDVPEAWVVISRVM
jgi:hypothetical protein